MLLSILSLASFALVAVLNAGVIKLAPFLGLVDLCCSQRPYAP